MLQVKFLLVGLLLAAGFIGYQWLNQLPAIPPVRLPEGAGVGVDSAAEQRVRERAAQEPVSDPGDLSAAAADQPSAEVLPALNDSDDWLRERMADIALPWLAQTELVRTSATVLENAARGELPRKFLEFLSPEGKFTVANRRGRMVADPKAHARYDSFVSTLISVPPKRAAQMFSLIEPLLIEALRELGGDSTGEVSTPRELAYTALGVALATPRRATEAALVRPKVIYKYADEEFEDLLPLQKQLLRMGPDNLAQVRSWLEAFGVALAPGLAGSAQTGDA